MKNKKEVLLDLLLLKGVHVSDIADIVYDLQKGYYDDLTIEDAEIAVDKVLSKREVQNASITALVLDDVSTESMIIPEPLRTEIFHDEGTYGVDEQIAMEICSVYGSIAITNFGYVDKTKPGIIGVLNESLGNTFIDDIVGAIASAGAAIIAHNHKKRLKKMLTCDVIHVIV